MTGLANQTPVQRREVSDDESHMGKFVKRRKKGNC
jgi:hypothetical protein